MLIQSATLKDLPIPPSVNRAYSTNWKTKRRFKSQDYQAYEAMILHWKQLHPANLASARQFTTLLEPGEAFKLELTFYFPRERILTKGKAATRKKPAEPPRPKRNDTSNRVKIAHDTISKLLDVDDCYFWDLAEYKVALNSDHPGFMDAVLTIIQID